MKDSTCRDKNWKMNRLIRRTYHNHSQMGKATVIGTVIIGSNPIGNPLF